MTEPISLCVVGLAAWCGTDRDEWRTLGAVDDPSAKPVPLSLRRRTSTIGLKLIMAGLSLRDTPNAHLVMTTRHAEFSRLPPLLEAITNREEMSPTEFSMSVHHGLLGLISIATGNRKGHSAISAGPESFCYGLLDAAACLARGDAETVVHLHYDEDPPPIFATLVPASQHTTPIALALACAPRSSGRGIAVDIAVERRPNEISHAEHAHRFVDFLCSENSSTVSVSNRLAWRWCRGH